MLPKVEAKSPALPDWSKTTRIRTKEANTCNVTMSTNIIFSLLFRHNGLAVYPLSLTIVAKECASRLAPPTRAPSMSSCAINSLALSGLTLPP